MRILFLADLHNCYQPLWSDFLNKKEPFDLICCLGDIDVMFLQQLRRTYPTTKTIGILGNHDYIGDLEYVDIENLHNKTIEYKNEVISGLEGCIRYKMGRHPMYTQEEYNQLISNMRTDTTLFISHNSPYTIHDKPFNAHEGCAALKEFIDNYNPKLVVHGHQHQNIITQYKDSLIINVYGGLIFDTTTNDSEKVNILYQE